MSIQRTSAVSFTNLPKIEGEKLQVHNTKGADIKKDGGALLAAGALATCVIGIAGVALTKGKNFHKTKEAFDMLINQAKAGNNVMSEAIQKEDKAVKEFITKYPEEWENIKKYISGLVDIKNADEVLSDSTLYHGTSTKSAKNILQNGVTPFSEKRSGSGSGMGYGFYTTPNLEAAKFYSKDEIVLPFRFSGKIATLKEGVKDDDIKANVIGAIASAIDPPTGKTGLLSMIHVPNQQAMDFAKDNQSYLVTKVMQELGIDAIYTKGATSRGGLLGCVLNNAPKFLDEAGQVAVFNGKAVELMSDKTKELNPIDRKNFSKFADLINNAK